MLARLSTFCIDGLDTRRVTVEVDIHLGLPAFSIVGLGDAAVREARERVRAALANAGFDFPQRRITVNLAPAHLRKTGSGFDVAIACGILAASGQVAATRLESLAVFGELSLTGGLRGCRGSLAVAEATRRSGLSTLLLPAEHAEEAALVDDLEVVGLGDLRDVARFLDGEEAASFPDTDPPASTIAPPLSEIGMLDLCDVRGHRGAIAALQIAAAGGHNLLLSGPPGAGKTMLARRLPSILPPLSRAEALEVTRIRSLAGLRRGGGLELQRPFRAPHHTISPSGLVGGGAVPAPGEATLAHHGVLFLDELSEFSRSATEALRQPLEDGRVAIVRGQRTAVFPTRITLIAATNPCPCGYAGEQRCRCGEADHARHARKLSGPLLDRIDLRVHVHRPAVTDLAGAAITDSATVRAAVQAARERQQIRLDGEPAAVCNAHLDAAAVRRTIRVSTDGLALLDDAYVRHGLSARARERILKVARTIADLDAAERVALHHVHQALTLHDHEHCVEVAA